MPRSASPGGGGRRGSRSRSSSRGYKKRSRSRSLSRSPRRERSRSPRGRSPPRGGASSAPPPIGEIVRGEVRSVAHFGAFVRVDGYEKEGLLHVSCLANYRVNSVEDIVQMGDVIYAKVIGHDNRGEGKYNLDIRGIDRKTGKDEDPDDRDRGRGGPPPRMGGGGGGGGGGRGPRDGNKDPPPRDSEHEGTVASIESFGAFVSINGYANDGLLHISKMKNERVNRVEDYLSIGDRIRVKVCRVDEDTGKYGLDMRDVRQSGGDDSGRGRDRYRGGDPMDDRDRRGGGGYRDDDYGRGGRGGGGYRDRDEADRYRDGGRR